MPLLNETVHTRLPIERAFRYVADFANSAGWDPGTAESKAIEGGEPKVGSRYALSVRVGNRVAPMEYEITDLEPNERVVLRGRGANVAAVDDIRFSKTSDGTRIDYSADIRLTGLWRLIEPFAGGAFKKIGRDAREGMQGTLDRMAEEAQS
jgi:uncharacterized protein YndB with AHSA1/START domain